MNPEWKALTPKGRIKKLAVLIGELIGEPDYLAANARKSSSNFKYHVPEMHQVGRCLFAAFAYERLTSKLTNVIKEALDEYQTEVTYPLLKLSPKAIATLYNQHIDRIKEVNSPAGDAYRHLYNEIWRRIKPNDHEFTINKRPAGHT
jgi:hypothetical protein